MVHGTIKDSNGYSISYANISINGWYRNFSDSLGNYKVLVKDSDKIQFSCIGYETMNINGGQLFNQPAQILNRSIINLDSIVVKTFNYISGFRFPKRIIKMGYEYNFSFEEGVIIADKSFEGQIIKSVSLSCGLKGNPKLPFRLNFYSLNATGLPDKVLNRDQIIIFPKDKLNLEQINLEHQKIQFPKDGVCISLELINPSTIKKKLGKNFMPIIAFDKKSTNQRVIRTDYLPNWSKFKNTGSVMAIGLEFLYP
jgi:hypothetical protein